MALSAPLFVTAVFAVLEGLAKGAVWPLWTAVGCFAAGQAALVIESWREA